MLTRTPAPPPEPARLFAGFRDARGLLLAVSGGPDSMALLELADRWRATCRLPVSVATVDHGLRAESRREAEAVAAHCRTRGLDHAILQWTGEKPVTGLPAAARAARYGLLADHALSIGADTIATAHHADDQAETILMRLLRGSGPAGLAGMAERAPVPGRETSGLTLVRPLLGLNKSDLVAVCQAASLPFVEDPTNLDQSYRRAQVRRLMTALTKEGFDRRALLRLGARARRAEAALGPAIHDSLEAAPARREPGLFEIAAPDMRDLSEESLIRLLTIEIARIGRGPKPRLEQVETLATRLLAGPSVAATLGGVSIRLDPKQLILRPQPARRAAGRRLVNHK